MDLEQEVDAQKLQVLPQVESVRLNCDAMSCREGGSLVGKSLLCMKEGKSDEL